VALTRSVGFTFNKKNASALKGYAFEGKQELGRLTGHGASAAADQAFVNRAANASRPAGFNPSRQKTSRERQAAPVSIR